MLLRAILCALFCTLVAAQSDVLAFTRVPNPVTDGEDNVLLWQTNDTNTPVSIILRQGPSTNLKTLMTLTTGGTGGQYIWHPNTSLADGTNYQLLIKQGSQNNTFGPFTVQGANPAAVSSASAASASSASRNATMTHRSGGNSTTMHRNTTMSHATLHHSTPKQTIATTTMTQSTTKTTATVATSTSGAASPGISTSGSSLALVLGAVAAIFYLH